MADLSRLCQVSFSGLVVGLVAGRRGGVLINRDGSHGELREESQRP